jgi:hypothetical protein
MRARTHSPRTHTRASATDGRVSDFAVLFLFHSADTLTAINFDKGAYLGADGVLPVEDALPGLGRDQHKYVCDKLTAVVVGAGRGR